MLSKLSSELGYSNGVGLCIAVARIERLSGQIEGLVFDLSLPLVISNVAQHSQEKSEQPWRHDVADWSRLR